jgi:hypothetical protein
MNESNDEADDSLSVSNSRNNVPELEDDGVGFTVREQYEK